MKYLFFLLLLWSCQENTLDITLTNKLLSPNDTLNINFNNKTNENYLLYFESIKLRYSSEAPHSLNLEILKNNKKTKAIYSISDPFWMLDEDGKMSKEDSILQAKYFDCINKDRSILIEIPAKKSVNFSTLLIDSIDECGRKNYPILETKTSYKVSIKINIDSNLISKKEKNKINRIRREKKVKLFQGQINSNSIILKS